VNGQFVISLDFELLWGLRDHADRQSYGANILGAREAVPRMLDLFAENDIHATWATVGFLFCDNKEELIECAPELLPEYENKALSNYAYFNEVGPNETADPYYFAPSLIENIKKAPFQEIGTHTLSHYYCLEDGQTSESFEADLRAAQRLAVRKGITLRSIVFPRNQFAPEHLDICRRLGIAAYRGNPAAWAYRAAKGSEQTALRRAMRLADAYTGLLGAQTFKRSGGVPANVPASRFLRLAQDVLRFFIRGISQRFSRK
jgi:peptidoglycan/xylan/chitin deacetylase (PgdA/CDA1 family)